MATSYTFTGIENLDENNLPPAVQDPIDKTPLENKIEESKKIKKN